MKNAGVAIAAVGLALFGCSADNGSDSSGITGGGAATGAVVTPFGGGSGGVGALGGGVGGASVGTAGVGGTIPMNAGSGGLPGGAVPMSGGTGGLSGGVDGGMMPTMSAGSGGDAGVAGMGGSGGSASVDGGAAGSSDAGIVSSGGPLHFGPNVRVNDDTGRAPQSEVALAVGDGVIVAGWNDGRDAAGRSGYQCGYSVSRDGGMTWSQNIFATTQGTRYGSFDGDPGVAADEAGNLYLSCEDYGVGQIVFASSFDDGMTFTSFGNAQAAIDKPWIAAARDGTVFLSWLGQPGGFTRSLDHGETWEPVLSLGPLSRGTGIASGSNGFVHIPFASDTDQLRYVRSKDWGETLEPAVTLDSIGMTQQSSQREPRAIPVVGCASDPSGEIVAITWAGALPGGDGDEDVWVLMSTDGGDSWSSRMRVNDNQQPSRQIQPWVAVDATGRVHVAWTDLRDGTNAVYYASATDPDEGFGPNVEVTDQAGDPNTFLGDYKSIVIQGEYVVVAWTDTRNGAADTDIYVARAKLDGSLP